MKKNKHKKQVEKLRLEAYGTWPEFMDFLLDPVCNTILRIETESGARFSIDASRLQDLLTGCDANLDAAVAIPRENFRNLNSLGGVESGPLLTSRQLWKRVLIARALMVKRMKTALREREKKS